jgi:hypothetical protein
LYRCGRGNLRNRRRPWHGLRRRLAGRREELEGGIVGVAIVTVVGATSALVFVIAAAAAIAHAQRGRDVEALLERFLDGGVLAAVEEGSRGEEELVGAGEDSGWGEGHEQADPVLTRGLTHVAGHVDWLFARETAPELFEYSPIRLALCRRRWEVLAIELGE